MKKLAVIPARGGSTRLKDKNIFPLGDKPLIRWMVEAVVNTNSFDKIVISTDSDKIYDSVSDLPVERHIRQKKHATVSATVLEAMLDLLQNEKESYEIFGYFLPTCPFVEPGDIIKGLSVLQQEGIDTVVSMTQILETIQLACSMKEDWVIPIFDNLEAGLTNSKFIKKYYKPSGAFYIGKTKKILENKNFFKGNVKGVIMPFDRSVDINDIKDISLAESILKNR